ncbi:hypothetical protein CBA19CS11_16595 [Caballeronia novacaledonica]|nr:hypothetical protein CBA19CS11_16595 [Caballeronia novacaledonica]
MAGFRSGKGPLGINEPLAGTQRRQPLSEGRRSGKSHILAEELQLAATVCVGERFEEAGSDEARLHAHRQETTWPAGNPARAVGRQSPAGDDAMHVRMMRERRTPSVQNGAAPI